MKRPLKPPARPSDKILDIALQFSPSFVQKSTGIPASTYTRYITGQFKPSPTTLARLTKMARTSDATAKYRYARSRGLTSKEARAVRGMKMSNVVKYSDLRSVGVSVDTARLRVRNTPQEIKSLQERYREVARKLSKKHKVSMKHIFRGMSFSDRTLEQWERYIREKVSRYLRR